MSENLIILRTVEEVKALTDKILDESVEFVAYDSETDGLEKDCEIVGYSVAWELNTAYYVVLAEWKPSFKEYTFTDGRVEMVPDGGELVRYDDVKAESEILIAALTLKKLVMHNCVFDCEVAYRQFGIQLIDSVHTDTLELSHLINENEPSGLKQVGAREFGETATAEQEEMKASVLRNGGLWMGGKESVKEMYKADAEILGKYGAKDTILTLKIFYLYVPMLIEQGLDQFFYDDESMPAMRTVTYHMNTTGLKVDVPKMQQLERELTVECARLKTEIMEEIRPHVVDKYPGTKATNTFNIGSTQQLSWLLFIRLGNEFKTLSDKGRDMAKEITGKVPYDHAAKRRFISAMTGRQEMLAKQLETATDKELKKSLTADIKKYAPEKYIKCDKDTLTGLAKKYNWVAKLLYFKAAGKILKTYVVGIQNKVRYGTIYPSFLQHGTTSGRYSSTKPNFQNLPRDDKRVKACIVSRPGMSFVGADYSQLEPRVFASVSQATALMECFARGEDFYSVVGIPVFKRFECSTYKKDENSLDKLFPHLRQNSKTLSLASAYGTTANQQATKLRDEEGNNLSVAEAQELIDSYFDAYPEVKKMMEDSHNMAMTNGVVYSLFGRPRRIPEAKRIREIYGKKAKHSELPYEYRTLLNLGMNHRVQSTGASIVNRAAIAFIRKCREMEEVNPVWAKVRLVLQVHDELVAEAPDEIAVEVASVLKDAMENTVVLDGVGLVAEPKVAKNLAELK